MFMNVNFKMKMVAIHSGGIKPARSLPKHFPQIQVHFGVFSKRAVTMEIVFWLFFSELHIKLPLGV